MNFKIRLNPFRLNITLNPPVPPLKRAYLFKYSITICTYSRTLLFLLLSHLIHPFPAYLNENKINPLTDMLKINLAIFQT